MLTTWMNEHSDFWYRHVHGDKDTFHIAWRKLGVEYAMPPFALLALENVMCQHDFAGGRVFQHRNLAKWTCGENPRIAGFEMEDDCLRHLAALEALWTGRPDRPLDDRAAAPAERRLATALCARRWNYRRVGHDERPMTFGRDGRVLEGAAGCERTWNVVASQARPALSIAGRDGVTCTLTPAANGAWTGRWRIHEKMPVELTPEPEAAGVSGGRG